MADALLRSDRPLFLLPIVAILGPFGGVGVDKVPYFAVVKLIADHVFVKRALPDVMAQFPIDKPLQRTDRIRYCRRRERNNHDPANGSVFV